MCGTESRLTPSIRIVLTEKQCEVVRLPWSSMNRKEGLGPFTMEAWAGSASDGPHNPDQGRLSDENARYHDAFAVHGNA